MEIRETSDVAAHLVAAPDPAFRDAAAILWFVAEETARHLGTTPQSVAFRFARFLNYAVPSPRGKDRPSFCMGSDVEWVTHIVRMCRGRKLYRDLEGSTSPSALYEAYYTRVRADLVKPYRREIGRPDERILVSAASVDPERIRDTGFMFTDRYDEGAASQPVPVIQDAGAAKAALHVIDDPKAFGRRVEGALDIGGDEDGASVLGLVRDEMSRDMFLHRVRAIGNDAWALSTVKKAMGSPYVAGPCPRVTMDEWESIHPMVIPRLQGATLEYCHALYSDAYGLDADFPAADYPEPAFNPIQIRAAWAERKDRGGAAGGAGHA